jgi:hypothetical protein
MKMDEKSKQSVDMRKIQEQTANLIAGGFHKEVAKYHKAIYDAYIAVGFTPEQAIDLVKASCIR